MLLTLGRGISPACPARARQNSWTPLNIATLSAWYDASDETTIHDSAGAVDQWDDKSGNAQHLSSLTSYRPETGTATMNGQNVLHFPDGVTRYLSLNGTLGGALISGLDKTGSTVAMVFKRSTAPASGAMVSFRSGVGGDIIEGDFSVQNTMMVPSQTISGIKTLLPTPAPNNTAYHMLVTFTPSEINAYLDNTQVINHTSGAASNHFDRFVVGARAGNGYPWYGDIAEICVFSTALDETERLALHSYFASKWGLS